MAFRRYFPPLLSLLLSATVAKAQDDCALIIPGGSGGRFDTCITVDAVDAAFLTAKDRVGLPPPKKEFSDEDIGNLGTVVQEASRILAEQYGLSSDAVAAGLPLIDTKKSAISNYCPALVRAPRCDKVSRYREVTGVCNNLKNPFWATSRRPFHRFLPPDYADGVSAPRAARSGRALPSARAVSATVHGDLGFHDHAVTIMLVAWGQFMDHDVTLTAETRDPRTGKTPKCCDGVSHPNCLPIEIPSNDPFYSKHNQRCMNFVRAPPALSRDCALGPRTSMNLLSSNIDAGTVYSNSEETLRSLRAFEGGRLKMLPVFDEFNMKELLPLKLEAPDEGCIRPSEDVYCFLAGDARVNEQTVLAVVHTLFVREHNRMADELAKVNPHWNDETIFQETRHIIAAIMQHITYNEFLPMVLGKEVMHRHGLVLVKNGYSDTYDASVNPTTDNGFATAAFRFGHTLLPSTIERWSKTHRYVGSQRLSEMLQQPYDLYKGGWMDTYIMGLINQVAQAYDDSITQEVTNHLFQEPGKLFGLDLASLNMQRGREHGLPSYNRWREWCGFPAFRSWDDMLGAFNNKTVAGYAQVYEHPDDVDLWSAGVSERPLPGSLMGPTFACIMGRQFHNLRHGDRYWYENPGWPSSFTLEQLSEIKKVKLSRILCDNGDDMHDIQVFAMVLPDHEINPRLPCKSSVLPRLDLSKWRDASFQSSQDSFRRPF